eukprot:gene3877-4420_t
MAIFPGFLPLSGPEEFSLLVTASVLTLRLYPHFSFGKQAVDHQEGQDRKLSFPDAISRDVCIRTDNLATAMMDRGFWRSIVDSMLSTAVD